MTDTCGVPYLSAIVLDTTVSKQTWSLLRKGRNHKELKNKGMKLDMRNDLKTGE